MKILVLCMVVFLSGCLARPVVVKPHDDEHVIQNQAIEKAVLETATSGDWLVIRGYHAVDNLVSNATGIPISHAGIFDADSRTVIEAEGQGVHVSALPEFVDKSFRLLVIRPRWLNDGNRQRVIENAREMVGKNYDFLGTIGFNFPSKYYCSELAIFIYKPWFGGKEKFPKVIKPGEMYLYGQVVYDSRPRDEIE